MTELQTYILTVLSDKTVRWEDLVKEVTTVIECSKRSIGKALLDLEARGLIDSTTKGIVAVDKPKRNSYNNGYHNMTGRKKG